MLQTLTTRIVEPRAISRVTAYWLGYTYRFSPVRTLAVQAWACFAGQSAI